MQAFGRVLSIGRALRVAGDETRVKERLLRVINRSLTGYWLLRSFLIKLNGCHQVDFNLRLRSLQARKTKMTLVSRARPFTVIWFMRPGSPLSVLIWALLSSSHALVAQPSNDDYAQRAILSGFSNAVQVSNVGATGQP